MEDGDGGGTITAAAGYFQDVGRHLSADLSAGVGVALVDRLTFCGPEKLDDVVLREPIFTGDTTPPVTQVRLEGTLGSRGW